jgi:elongator complex protein 3
MEKIYDELIGARKKLSDKKFARFKIELCRKYHLVKVPRNIDLLLYAKKGKRGSGRLDKLLVTKPVRTISGVAVVAVMTKPAHCKHGRCVYCPGGPNSFFGSVPQSYTGKEPASMRAIRAGYDPYLQVFNRLEQYVVTGHVMDKVELIIMGGTFPSLPKRYQEEFVAYCFKALNDFSAVFFKKGGVDIARFQEFFELPGDFTDKERVKRVQQKILKLKKKAALEEEQKRNEKAKIRCIGLTVETRSDFGKLKEGNHLLRLGCTRVEVGVQTVYDGILKKIKRGHAVKDTIESFRILKDLGFKINAHYMLGLPGASRKQDLAGLKRLFSDERFRPDMLKIYPCMVFEGTELYDLWKRKQYKPITTKEAAETITRFKKIVPEYVRIMRVQRDIPTMLSAAGVDRTNLRQYVQELAKKKKIKCGCIRCREAGRAKLASIKNLKINSRHYKASEGIEFFISAKKGNTLFGYCRLRFPSQWLRKELKDAALVRELHIFSASAELGKKVKESFQHRGIGKALLAKAERIAEMYYKKKVVVIAGIGAKPYFFRLGYKRAGPYMSKVIR